MLALLRLMFAAVRVGAEGGSTSADSSVYDSDEQAERGGEFHQKTSRVLRGDTRPWETDDTRPGEAGDTHPGEAASPILSDAQWTCLREFVAKALALQLRPAHIARELLSAIDTTVRQNLWRPFLAAGGQRPLQPGDFFPVASHNLKPFFAPEKPEQVSLTPRPSSTCRGLKQLTYLGVLPQLDEPYEVEFNFEAGVALSDFCAQPLLGVLLPNIDMLREFHDPRCPEEGTFFGVRPLDEPVQWNRIQALLDQAEALGVKLVLLPELAVTQELSRQLGQYMAGPTRRLPVLVAGSFHFTEEERQVNVNRSQAFAVGLMQPLEHDKFNPYVMKQWDGKELESPLREKITERPRRLTIHWSEDGWSFTTLICKDFLDQDTLKLLDALRINFVFVVALSSETDSFRRGAERLLDSGQTMTFVANFGGHPEATSHAALAVLPVAGTAPSAYPSCQVRAPSLLVFDLRRHQLGWLRAKQAET